MWHALLFAFVAALLWVCTGCVYKGAKVVEGTDLAIGVELPGSDGVAQLNLLNYLSGFRLAVDKNAILKVDYSVAETNTYLGVVSTATRKTIKATVEPCEVDESKEAQQ